MADEIASLGFKVDSNGLVKADQRLDRVTESGKRTERQNEMVGDSFGRMAKMVGVATAALAGFGAGSKLLDIARQFDVFEAQLKTATGSISEARDVMQELMEFAESTPFDVSQSIQGFVKLKNLGLDPSIESLRSYGNTASAMGTSLNQMVEAVADAATFEFERLKEFGIRASQEADRVIFTFQGVETSVAKNSQAIQEYLLNIGNTDFASASKDRMESLDGALSNLTDSWNNLFLAVSDQGAGDLIEEGALSASSALQAITDNIEALTDAMEVLLFAGSSYAAFMSGKYITSTIAAVAANKKQIASNAIMDAAYKKSVASKLAGDEAKIASEVRLLKFQQSSLANRIAITKSESNLASLRSVLTGVNARLSTTESALSVATQRTAAATTASAAASGVASSAITAQTGRAMAATAAMNAFGAASRFALGPWGLLITAVGAAAATFMSTKDEAEDLTEKINEQAKYVRKATEDYKEMNKQGKDLFWLKSKNQISDFLGQIINIDNRISKLKETMSSVDSGSRQDIRDKIQELKEQREEYQSEIENLRAAQAKIFELGMPSEWNPLDSDDSGAGDPTEEVNEQIRALEQLQAEIGMTSDELFVYRQRQKAIAQEDGAVDQVTALSNAIVQARRNLKFDEQVSELSSLQEQVGKTSDELFVLNQVTSAKEAGFSDEQITRVREMAESLVDLRKGANEASEYERWVESVNNSHRSISDMTAEINKLKEAIEMGDVDPEAGKAAIKEIREEMDRLTESKSLSDMFADGMSAAQQGAMAMREFAEQGTKEYERLTRAAQAFGVAQSLATGNYLGAIAGAASIISSLGSYDFKDISAEVQANQNLNVWGEKSESIDRSTEITANATEKLVGINTDMLKAFQNMDNTIAKAAGILSRDVSAPQVDIGGLGIMDNVFSFITDNPIADAFNKITLGIFSGVFDVIGGWLGGSSKVVDEGVRIFGGTLSDLIEEVAVQGYQVVKYKKWRFGSTKTSRKYSDLTGEAGGEIAEIFGYMGDAIAGGMEQLAFTVGDIDLFFSEFAKIDTKKLSLKGLSAEQQKKELEAYFSDAFNTLVYQFDQNFLRAAIGNIKRIDEEYGEAFTRIVTQSQVLNQAVSDFGLNFGVTLDDVKDKAMEYPGDDATDEELREYRYNIREIDRDRYLFVRAADDMANLTGGLDSFIEKLNGFSSFASDATNLEILGGRLESRFASLNMELPDSADALWDMIQGIDGTTQAGREQIATILNLQDSAKAYYQLLERENNRLLDERKSQLAESLNAAREQYEAEKERINLLKEGVNEQISALKEQKAQLDSNLSDAESAVDAAYNAEIEAIRSAGQERVDQLSKEKQLTQQNISLLSGVIDNANSAINSIYSSPETAQASLSAAISAARGGDFKPASNIDFGSAFSGTDAFASESEFALEQAKTANKIAMLGELAGEQKSIEEQTLDGIESQIEATNSQTERQVEALKAQKDALLGVDESLLTIHEANSAYRRAKSAIDRLDYDSKLSYYESELERMDMLLESNQEVFDMHKTHYEKQIEILEEGNFTNEELRDMIAGIVDNGLKIEGSSSLSNVQDLGGYEDTGPDTPSEYFDRNKELVEEIKKLRQDQQIANAALADNTNRTAKELQDIKFNGLETN